MTGNSYLSFVFHSSAEMWQCLQLGEVLGQQNIWEQLCTSAEQGNRIGIDFFFFIVIKRLQWNIKPAKPWISKDADNERSLPVYYKHSYKI